MKADAFALLGLPRRALLSADEVRAAFQKLGAGAHPDGATAAERPQRTEEFAALNEAFAVLTSLPRRLRHLLELEYPDTAATKTGVVMDGAMMEIFSRIAAALQTAASVQARKQKAGGAIVRAMLASEEMIAQETLAAAMHRVKSARAELERELVDLELRRERAEDVAPSLKACAARAGFLEKWQAQLQAAFAGFSG